MTKKGTKGKRGKKRNNRKKKYLIRYDIGSFFFGILGIIGSLIPLDVWIRECTALLQIYAYYDITLYKVVGKCVYNLWALALLTGILAENRRQRSGLLVIGVLLGLASVLIIVWRETTLA